MMVHGESLGRLRLFLFVEAVSFAVASMIHAGLFVAGYRHSEASVAEAVIATVLFAGLLLSWILPAWMRAIALVAQLFALFGTLVGIFTIVVGVGPRTVPDLVYHGAIVGVLVWGLYIAMRARSDVLDHQP